MPRSRAFCGSFVSSFPRQPAEGRRCPQVDNEPRPSFEQVACAPYVCLLPGNAQSTAKAAHGRAVVTTRFKWWEVAATGGSSGATATHRQGGESPSAA